jgi:very-short-patch-repair endonuclease
LAKVTAKSRPYEDKLLETITETGLPIPEREFKFLDNRRFRFDFAWPDIKLACEVDGNVWHGGRHTTGTGFTADCEKFALATIEGWRVIRVTTGHVKSGKAIEWLQEFFKRQLY